MTQIEKLNKIKHDLKRLSTTLSLLVEELDNLFIDVQEIVEEK